MDDADEPTRVLDRPVASDSAQAIAAADDDVEMPEIDAILGTLCPRESVSAAGDIGDATEFDGGPSPCTAPGIGGEIRSKDEAAVSGSADSLGAAISVGVASTEDPTESADPAGGVSRTTTIGMGAPHVAAPTADPAEATSRTTTLGMGAPEATAPVAEPATGVSKTTTLGMGSPHVESAATDAVAPAGAAVSDGAAASEAVASARQEPSDARGVSQPTFSQQVLDRGLEQGVSAQLQSSEAPVARDAIVEPQRKSNRRLVGFALGAAALGAAFALYSHMQPGNPSIRETPAVAVRVPAAAPPHELAAFDPAVNEQAAGEEAETEPAEEKRAPKPAAAEVAQAKQARAIPEKAALPQADRAAVDTKRSPKPSVARKAPVAPAPEVTPVAEAEASSAPEPAAKPAFDPDAAARILDAVAASASSCRAAGEPSGYAVVTITFAPSGRVTVANVAGPHFAGTATGSCIASKMHAVRVPAFEGAHVTVRRRVMIL
jgi:hypothetical protein